MSQIAIQIPPMSKKEICELYRRIKPIVRIDEVPYYMREFSPSDLTEKSYIWNRGEDKTVPANMEELETIMDNKTLHKYGYHGLFKPSIGEVISQIPKDVLEKVVAFEIVYSPESWDDFNRYIDEFNAGFHVSSVRLYSKKC